MYYNTKLVGFGCLLRSPAWKWNGPILNEVDKQISKEKGTTENNEWATDLEYVEL